MDLFKYFDEHEIYVWVAPQIQYTRAVGHDEKNTQYHIEDWTYTIYDKAKSITVNGHYESRKVAEEMGFQKAFEILNERK